MSFWQQDFALIAGSVFILIELSTPFVCIRWHLFHHKLVTGHPLQTLNTVSLFLSFIFGRVFYQLIVIIWYAIPWITYMYTEAEGVPLAYYWILAEMQLAVLINVVLNFFWAWLIIRQVIRIFQRGSKADADFGGDVDIEKSGGDGGEL